MVFNRYLLGYIRYIYTPKKNLRTSAYVFPLFNTESLIFKIENIFKFKGYLKYFLDKIGN